MKLEVVLSKDAQHGSDRGTNLPDEWPRFVYERDDDFVINPPHLEMTLDEYNSYRILHQDKYDVWKEALVLKRKKEEEDKEAPEKAKRDALRDKLGITQEEFDLLRK